MTTRATHAPAQAPCIPWKVLFITGMGFFTDAYDLFVIGIVMSIVRPLWHVTQLQDSLVESTALLASAFGALLFGRIADMIGRKRIYGFELLVLAFGAIGCALSPNIWWLLGLRFLLGVGVGGDYPISATIMSEHAPAASRGMAVSLVFAMQAAGLIFSPLFATALLAGHIAPTILWRLLVGFGAVPALIVYPLRLKMRESDTFLKASGCDEDSRGRVIRRPDFDESLHSVSFWDGFHRLVNNKRLLTRLVGASLAWFLMDFAYYGNTVSSPLVLSALGAESTLIRKTLTQLVIFVIFAAPGYVVAILTMDRLGRKVIQNLGFALMAVSFAAMALIPGIEHMVAPFVVLYGISFFFTEFGPNSTTFVYPSEIFPIRVRSTGHGISAAMGKLGGFLGVFTFPYLMEAHGLRGAETAAAVVSVLGLIATWALLPETKGISLEELSGETGLHTERAKAA